MLRTIIFLFLTIWLSACETMQKPKDSSKQSDSEVPKLTKPVVRKVWVPPQIEDDGKVYRDGHFKYLLERESVWSR